tara:strand:- start:221 stop:1057 length:837 start_codon:yes stop_codon:yes gene_type:complete
MNIEELKKWIGSSETSEDIITSSLEQRFRATLDIDPGNPKKGDVASSGIHWTLAPPVYKHSDLGKDSHPKKGGFLPPVSLPRRMWAGCETYFYSRLYIGDNVTKISSIDDISLKEGKSGKLFFVRVKYQFYVDNEIKIKEFHDIVYREINTNNNLKKVELPFNKFDDEKSIYTHPTIMFRYSAITFNGHRIHYDYPYCTKEEFYPDLVFHGPLQATLLLNLSEKNAEKSAKKFIHRGVSPVFANMNLKLKLKKIDNNEYHSFSETDLYGMAMEGKAYF